MFFREKKTRKARVLQLVENSRNAEGKVRQRLVVSLGGCPVPDEHRKRVAAELTRRLAGYESFLSEEPVIEYWVNRVLERMKQADRLPTAAWREVEGLESRTSTPIVIDSIEHEDGVRLGPSLVLLRAWESLGLDPVLREQGFSREQLATCSIA